MDIDNIWYEGYIGNIQILNNDLEQFPEKTINEKDLHARLDYINSSGIGSVFIYRKSLINKPLIVQNWEGHFKNFKSDLENQTTKFDYNGKRFNIYQSEEVYKKRWQFDFEETFNK